MSVTPPVTLRTQISEAALQLSRGTGLWAGSAVLLEAPQALGGMQNGLGMEWILLSNVVLSGFWCSTEPAPREHRVELVRLQDHPELGPGESLGQRVRSERLQSEYFHGASMNSQLRAGAFLQKQSMPCVCEHIFPAAPTCRIPLLPSIETSQRL